MVLSNYYRQNCTFFSQWQEYIRSERTDWTPHITRFHSLRMIAAAIQIPGWCAAPTLVLFRWSLCAAMEESAFIRSGAWDSSSMTNADQLNPTIWESGIFLNKELFSWDLQHRLLHSSLMAPKNKENSDSHTSSKAITAWLLTEHVHQLSDRPLCLCTPLTSLWTELD